VSADVLTPAELRELRYAAQGYSASEVAAMTPRTAKAVSLCRRRAFKKLGARNVTHAVHVAHLAGILSENTSKASARAGGAASRYENGPAQAITPP
jgi:DNA-binding CsgD family transcriptional regulator